MCDMLNHRSVGANVDKNSKKHNTELNKGYHYDTANRDIKRGEEITHKYSE